MTTDDIQQWRDAHNRARQDLANKEVELAGVRMDLREAVDALVAIGDKVGAAISYTPQHHTVELTLGGLDRLIRDRDEARQGVETYAQWVNDKSRDLRTVVASVTKGLAALEIANVWRANATVLLIEAVQHGGLPTVLRQRINGFLGEEPKASGGPVTNPPAIGEDGCVVPQWCGSPYIGELGEFACDRYIGHDGNHLHSLAEYEWADSLTLTHKRGATCGLDCPAEEEQR